MGKISRRKGIETEAPFLPVNFFLQGFSLANRRMFFLLLVIVGLVAFYLFWINLYPFFWTPVLQPLAESIPSSEEIVQVQDPYLSFPVNFSVYRNWVSYFAGPMLAHMTPTLLFVGIQLLAWSIALATATYIRSQWAYVVYFLYLIFLFLSSAYKYFLPNFSYPLLEAGVSIWILLCAYLFQSGRWRGSFPLRLIVFSGTHLLLYGALFYLGNWQAWYFTTLNQFLYLYLLSIGFMAFVSKELVNSILILANHQVQPQQRWPILYLRLSWLFLLGLLFLLLRSFLSPTDAYASSASLLFFLLGIFAVATPIYSQNLFRSIQHILESHSILAFLLISWALLTLSFLGLHLSHGDLLLIRTTAKIFAVFLFAVSLSYIIFLESNFPDLLSRRKLVFFLLGKGRVFPFWMVFILGAIIFSIFQGLDNWKTIRILSHSRLVLEGDASMLANQPEAAQEFYEWAIVKVPASPKANYNQGSLYMLDPSRAAIAVGYFRKSLSLYELPQARLNASQLLQDIHLPESAVDILKEGISTGSYLSPQLAQNLSLAFAKENLPDSAIGYMNQTLEETPSFSAGHSQLASFYFDQGKDSLGRIHWERSIEGMTADERVATNVLYYAITHPELGVPWEKLPEEVYAISLAHNIVLAQMNAGRFEQARQYAERLAEQGNDEELELVQGFLELRRDSLEKGISKLKFMAQSQQEYRSQALYLLGVALYEKGLKQMAQKYLGQSADSGRSATYLSTFQVHALKGNQDQVPYIQLEDSLPKGLKREWQLLEMAGEHDSVSLTRDDLSSREKLRLCTYASLNKNCQVCREVDAFDPDSLLLREEQLLSLLACVEGERRSAHLQELINQFPGMDRLRNQLIEHLIAEGEIDSATYFFTPLSQAKKSSPLWAPIRAELAMASQDTLGALEILQTHWQAQPWNEKIGEKLVGVYMATGAYEEALTHLNRIFSFNDQNPQFWQYYQEIMTQWGMTEEAGYAAERLESLVN